jgi:beta-glucosidase
VAVIGQSVSDTNAMTGNYNGPLCVGGGAKCFPSLGEAITTANKGGTTTVVAGVDVAKAVAAAKAADAVVLAVDNFRDGGGEGHDRYTIGLNAAQTVLAHAVIAANKNTVLVTINGGLISLDELKESAPAILNAGMPGVQGGTAIAATIFGSNNPGGKLPVVRL